jgi:hypothetical protein
MSLDGFDNHLLPRVIWNCVYKGMSEKGLSDDESTTQTTTQNQVVIDALRDNAIRMVDEAAKIQPQLAHSITKLHFDSIETAKSLIETFFTNQKQVFPMLNISTFMQQDLLPEQVAKYSVEITNNAFRSVGIFHAIAVNTLDAYRENLKIYSRTLDAAIKYNTDALKTGASYWTPLAFQ